MSSADWSSLSLVRHRPALLGDTADLRFSGILRKRRRPLLFVLDHLGGLLHSSLPGGATLAEQRLAEEAAERARRLLRDPPAGAHELDPEAVQADGQRWSLIVVDEVAYSVRLFPLHGAGDENCGDHFVAVVELIGAAQSEGIDFAAIKARFRLSNRELDVLAALMTGTKDKEIARNLGVTVGTVRAYLKAVRAKLGVTSRTAAVNLVHEASGRSST